MADISNWDSSIGEASSPEEWAKFVLQGLEHESVVLASGARRIDTSAKKVHVPRLSDVGVADWYAELDEIGPGDPSGEDLTLTPYKCAALTVLSDEVVTDSDPSVLNTVGDAMVRATALEVDRALFVGGGGGTIGPEGFMNTSPTLQNVQAGTITYASVVTAGGSISAYGGRPDSLYLSPSDYTQLQLETAGDGRPLIQPDASNRGAATVAGFRAFVTPALGGGTAVVAQADQLVVAVRSDASVAFSTDAMFEKDATGARVIARVDGAVADARGVCTIGVT